MAMVFPEASDLNTFNPVLCEETPSVENGGISADGLTYTFKLKKGIKFHTGGEMTAKDWVFSMKRLHYRKGNPSFLADPLVDADGNVMAEAVDDYTLKLTLNAPNVAFMAYMAGQLGQVATPPMRSRPRAASIPRPPRPTTKLRPGSTRIRPVLDRTS